MHGKHTYYIQPLAGEYQLHVTGRLWTYEQKVQINGLVQSRSSLWLFKHQWYDLT